MSKSLLGKTVVAIYLAEDKMAIKFNLDNGESVIAKTDGDCCSHSWIEHLESPELILGSPVLAVEDVPMPDLPRGEEDDYELLQSYGCKIKTAKGEMLLEYRNGSNGYYGGSLSWPEDGCFYGGVYGQNISKEEWRKVA
jgi:hypothetical protein